MRGSLSEFTLTHLLQLFSFAERTGAISVDSGEAHARLSVEVGRVTGLDIDGFDVRDTLLRCELLSSASRAALQAITPRADTPGLSMLARNVIDPERWDALVQRLLEQHVFPLLNTEQGGFEVVVGRCPPPALRMSMPIQQLILDASRWEAETEALDEQGYRAESVWRRANSAAMADGAGRFSGAQWLIWAITTEPISIAEAARRLCVPDLAAAGAVRSLHSLGVLESALA